MLSGLGYSVTIITGYIHRCKLNSVKLKERELPLTVLFTVHTNLQYLILNWQTLLKLVCVRAHQHLTYLEPSSWEYS